MRHCCAALSYAVPSSRVAALHCAALPACLRLHTQPQRSAASPAAATNHSAGAPARRSTWEEEVRTALTDTWKITDMRFVSDLEVGRAVQGRAGQGRAGQGRAGQGPRRARARCAACLRGLTAGRVHPPQVGTQAVVANSPAAVFVFFRG